MSDLDLAEHVATSFELEKEQEATAAAKPNKVPKPKEGDELIKSFYPNTDPEKGKPAIDTYINEHFAQQHPAIQSAKAANHIDQMAAKVKATGISEADVRDYLSVITGDPSLDLNDPELVNPNVIRAVLAARRGK